MIGIFALSLEIEIGAFSMGSKIGIIRIFATSSESRDPLGSGEDKIVDVDDIDMILLGCGVKKWHAGVMRQVA